MQTISSSKKSTLLPVLTKVFHPIWNKNQQQQQKKSLYSYLVSLKVFEEETLNFRPN